MTTIGEAVQAQEFDHVWTIRDSRIVDVDNLYAPSVMNDDSEGGDIEIESSEWEGVLRGWTGQHGYNGHVMHASEYIGEGIGQHIATLAADGFYDAFAVVTVECYPEDDDDQPEPAGWTIVGHRAA